MMSDPAFNFPPLETLHRNFPARPTWRTDFGGGLRKWGLKNKRRNKPHQSSCFTLHASFRLDGDRPVGDTNEYFPALHSSTVVGKSTLAPLDWPAHFQPTYQTVLCPLAPAGSTTCWGLSEGIDWKILRSIPIAAGKIE